MTELSLRERKYAATKADLMHAVLKRLGTERLDNIKVKDICKEVMVSEPTFFNYFPTKSDVIVYRVQLWSIEVAWSVAEQLKQHTSNLDIIRNVFELTARVSSETPGLMSEVVAFQALHAAKIAFTPLKPAEYAQYFPDNLNIENFPARGINQILEERLAAAQEQGELKPTVDLQALGLTLMSIFFMTPVMVPQYTAQTYRQQLQQLLPDEA